MTKAIRDQLARKAFKVFAVKPVPLALQVPRVLLVHKVYRANPVFAVPKVKQVNPAFKVPKETQAIQVL